MEIITMTLFKLVQSLKFDFETRYIFLLPKNAKKTNQDIFLFDKAKFEYLAEENLYKAHDFNFCFIGYKSHDDIPSFGIELKKEIKDSANEDKQYRWDILEMFELKMNLEPATDEVVFMTSVILETTKIYKDKDNHK